ncbi:MAG: tetratricopeptide repeat protein [Cyanobacteriota bacterium]|nr:tetratricopeptide repeat protein [Cyanobacteriota bacterium]
MSKDSEEVVLKNQFDRAKQLKDEGKFDEALPLLLETIETVPTHVRALMQLVEIHQDCQEWDRVATYCQRVVEIQPQRIGVYLKLAKALQKQGDTVGAIATYQKAIALKPDQPPNIYTNFGNLLSQEDRVDEAVDAYRQSLKRKSEQPQLHMKLGALLTKRGQFGVAAEYYQQALMLKPEWGEYIQMQLANVRMQQGQLDEAISHYQTAIRINPNLAEAYQALGDIFQQQGASEEALENYQQSDRLKPNNPEVRKAIEAATPKPAAKTASEPNILEEFTTLPNNVPSADLATKGSSQASGKMFQDKFKKMGKFKIREKPKIVDQKQLEGKEIFPSVDIQWNRSSIIVFSLFLGIPYIGGLIAAFSSGVKAFMIAMTVGPILLLGFVGLLYFASRSSQ